MISESIVAWNALLLAVESASGLASDWPSSRIRIVFSFSSISKSDVQGICVTASGNMKP
jgi:hypothetical protein